MNASKKKKIKKCMKLLWSEQLESDSVKNFRKNQLSSHGFWRSPLWPEKSGRFIDEEESRQKKSGHRPELWCKILVFFQILVSGYKNDLSCLPCESKAESHLIVNTWPLSSQCVVRLAVELWNHTEAC